MVKTLDQDMLGDILKNSPSQYFFHREDVGEVQIVFETPISITEPGDTDLVDRVWEPPITDADGNPLIGFDGNPREPWAKVEAKVLMDGAPKIYAFGGTNSSHLRSFIAKMNAEGIKNENLPGTKWSINRTGKWDWVVEYLGKEELSAPSSPAKVDESYNTIKSTIVELKNKNPDVTKGMEKNQLLQTISIMSGIKDVAKYWDVLIKDTIIKVKDNKVFVI